MNKYGVLRVQKSRNHENDFQNKEIEILLHQSEAGKKEAIKPILNKHIK